MRLILLVLLLLLSPALTLFAKKAPPSPTLGKKPPTVTGVVGKTQRKRLGPRAFQEQRGKITIKVRVTGPKEPHLGDVLTWSLTVTAPDKHEFSFPRLEQLLDYLKRKKSHAFRPLSEPTATAPRRVGATLQYEVSVRLLVLRTGKRLIPGFELTYEDDLKSYHSISTPRFRVKIHEYLAHENDPKLKVPGDPVPIIYRDTTLMWVMISFGALLLGGLLAWVGILLFRKPKQLLVAPPPPRPAHEIAFERLARIRALRLIEQQLVEAFSVEISEAFREYLGNRYGFDSIELTTSEILDRLKQYRISQFPLAHYETFLHECDLIKFAKLVPTTEEMEALMQTAYHTIERTMIVRAASELTPTPGEGARR